MRIGTWNVEYATAAKNARRLEVLLKNPADIWVLTETHDELSLPRHAAVPSEARPMNNKRGARKGSRWVTIWTRYPVRKRLPVCDEKRTVAALLDAPFGFLMVFGTVLPWASDRGDDPNGTVLRNWSEHYRIIDEQTKEWMALRGAYPGVPLCVAGDFNLNLGGPHWYGTKRGREAIRQAMKENRLVCTTEYDRIPKTFPLQHSPIDHVLISEELAATARVDAAWEGTTSDGVKLSDHSGLVVEITPTAERSINPKSILS